MARDKKETAVLWEGHKPASHVEKNPIQLALKPEISKMIGFTSVPQYTEARAYTPSDAWEADDHQRDPKSSCTLFTILSGAAIPLTLWFAYKTIITGSIVATGGGMFFAGALPLVAAGVMFISYRMGKAFA